MTREEALKSFEEENKDFQKIFERYGYQMSPEEVSAVKEAIERNKVAISALSADNTMEWLEDEDGSYECSKCHITRSGLISGVFNFCPNCGRKAVSK